MELHVAPLAGAWIEINGVGGPCDRNNVAPLAGAWIEINKKEDSYEKVKSLPLRERGLK